MLLQKKVEKQKNFQGSHCSIVQDQCLRKNASTLKVRKQRGTGPSIFITKTFEILQNMEFQDIIRWNNEGTSFLIADIEKFEQEVLPIYFRHSNYSSFVRQLNMYDFHKIRNQANQNIFEHKQFRRYSKQSLKNIRRKGCTNNKKTTYHKHQQNDQNQIPEVGRSPKTMANVGMSKATVQNSQTLIKKVYSPKYSVRSLENTSSPIKKKLIQEFMETLPDKIEDQSEIQEIIRAIKKQPKYSCLTKKDLKALVKKIKQNKLNRSREPNDLDDLSIQEEIIVENVDQPSLRNLSLAIFQTQKYIPVKSMSLIGSLNLLERESQFIFPH